MRTLRRIIILWQPIDSPVTMATNVPQIVIGCVLGYLNIKFSTCIVKGSCATEKQNGTRLFGLAGLAVSYAMAARLSSDLVCASMFVPGLVLLGQVGFLEEPDLARPHFIAFVSALGVLPQLPSLVTQLVMRSRALDATVVL